MLTCNGTLNTGNNSLSVFERLNQKVLNWLDGANKPIKLDELSSIRRIARDVYEYHEADHMMLIQVEMQSGNPDYFLYSSSIDRWQPPFENEFITASDKERILGKVREFLDRRRISYEVK